MKQLSLVAKKCRRTVTKAGLATLVFNKVSVTHFIVHEARLAGTIGLTQVVKWSVATVAGLGAYDAVSGATVITQLAPSVGSSTVPAEAGEQLNFVYQVTGREVEAESWEVEGDLPAGLVHLNSTASNVDAITGTPTEAGEFFITVRAYEKPNHRGENQSKAFVIQVAPGNAPPAITTQPDSVRINAGSTTTLRVMASGPSLSFQWYRGTAGDTSSPVPNANGASFATSALDTTTSFWVRISNPAGVVDSGVAVVTVVDTFTSWQTQHFNQEQISDPLISGPASDPDGDGTTNEEEFIFGTRPLVAETRLEPKITAQGAHFTVSFKARAATGPGYLGLTRHFGVEMSVDLTDSDWAMVPGLTDLVGEGQEISVDVQAPSNGNAGFYRLKVWLLED